MKKMSDCFTVFHITSEGKAVKKRMNFAKAIRNSLFVKIFVLCDNSLGKMMKEDTCGPNDLYPVDEAVAVAIRFIRKHRYRPVHGT